MATIKCNNKTFNEDNRICGSTFFEKVSINQFHDLPCHLYTGLREMEVDSDIKLYRCIRCGTLMLPPIDYHVTVEEDRKLYITLQSLINGEEVQPQTSNKHKPIHRGTVGFVKNSVKNNPDNHGKFVRVN